MVKLTPRESEAASLVLCGLTNRAIALKMSVAESTIKVMLKSVYRKEKVRTRAELAAKYAEGFLPWELVDANRTLERITTPLVVNAAPY